MEKLYSKFRSTAKKYNSRPVVKFKKNGKWHQYTYGEFLDIINKVATGFNNLGVKTGERVAIFSENRWEWLASDLALNKINAISVPIHATANKETIEYILNDSSSSWLLISEDLARNYKNKLSFFQYNKKIIIFGKKDDDLSLNIFFEDLIKKEQNNHKNFTSEAETEIASIIYTSGTTGKPKGVVLNNSNFLSNIESIEKRIKVFPTDKFLSFLPLSHVLERTVGNYIPITSGAMIAYSEGIKKLPDNLSEIKPTIVICVPRVLERAYSKVFENVKTKNKRARKIFFWALKQRNPGIKKILANIFVFKKLRKMIFGGKLRFAVSGGASLNENVLRFFKNTGMKIIEGYGLTETSPIISANSLEHSKIGTVGPPIDNVKVKIANDKEILVKGENVMQGYWNKEEMTKEVFNEKNWFKTGDLGFLDNDNFLTIIGRKKDIIVTSNGKNIAPEKLESLFNLNDFIEQSLIVGHKKDFLAALIVPSECLEKKYDKDFQKMQEAVMEEIKKINKDLPPYEQVKKIKILDKSFSIEEGELTPTLKLRRKIIEAKYDHVIKKIY